MKELTIQQACSQSANFMYVWADEDAFLKYINQKYARIIRQKKANQIKILELSAERYLGDYKRWNEYSDAIRSAFIEQWGHTPAEALVILAQGGSIAGKNWEEGVFGVGATVTFSNNPNITIDTKTGHIFNNGTDVTDTSKTVYNQVKNVGAVGYQLFATVDGTTYCTQYNKITKKYSAATYSNADGTFKAKNGSAVSSDEKADLWGAIVESLQEFLEWLINLFVNKDDVKEKEQLSPANTLPSQSADGFVSEAGWGEAGTLLLVTAAGGLILAKALGKKSKKSK